MSEKTEDPTPRRLARAREKGDVAVSSAASQALGFLVATMVVPAAVATTAAQAITLFRRAIAVPFAPVAPTEIIARVVLLVTPVLAATAAASAFASVVQTGALFAVGRMTPNLSKLDPVAGLRSLVSGQRLWTLGRALLAAIAVAFLAWEVMAETVADLAHSLGNTSGAVSIARLGAIRVARDAAVIGLFLGAIDLFVGRSAFRSRLKMSKDEIKREHRESEGDPQWKGARHRAHQEMLASATVNAVRDATVVIVNPEHLATALRYLDGEDEAPTVLATGAGELAERIKDAARTYGVPIVRDVPVARALQELQPGDTIPEALYEAVAAILSEVWSAEEDESSQRAPQ